MNSICCYGIIFYSNAHIIIIYKSCYRIKARHLKVLENTLKKVCIESIFIILLNFHSWMFLLTILDYELKVFIAQVDYHT